MWVLLLLVSALGYFSVGVNKGNSLSMIVAGLSQQLTELGIPHVLDGNKISILLPARESGGEISFNTHAFGCFRYKTEFDLLHHAKP